MQKQILGGTLPTPVEDTGGNTNTLYAVYFPPGTIIIEGGFTSCRAFCAYHGTSYTKGKGSQAFQYSVIPDFGQGSGCDQGCGSSPNAFDNVTSVYSHELAEAITNPQVGFASEIAYPLAWYNDTYGEVGDICNALQSPLRAKRKSYTVQQVWSQSQGACVSGPGASFVTSGASSIPSGSPLSLRVTVRNSAGVTLPFYTGTIAFSSTDASAHLPANYTFSSSDGGSHTFSVVLNTMSNQQISLQDVDVPSITGSLMTIVGKGQQIITFNQIAQQTLGANVALSASATSNLPLTFTSFTTSVCAVSGNTAAMLSVGICTIQASQAGIASYAAAIRVSQNISVGEKPQSITFGAVAPQTVGAKVMLSASASSHLPVTFVSLTAKVCAVNGNTAATLAIGTCTIQASQAGKGSYAAATPVSQNISVLGIPQSITFGAVAQQTVGAHVTLSPIASSHLPVELRSLTPAVCNVSGLTATLFNVGTCTIQASQPGNAQYAAASSVTQSFTVLPVPHFTINVNPTAKVVDPETPGIVTLKLQSVGGFNGKVTGLLGRSCRNPMPRPPANGYGKWNHIRVR